MPFANDCLDQIGVCPDRAKVFSTGQCVEEEVKITMVNPLTGEVFDLTKYGIGTSTSSSSESMSSNSCWPCGNLDENGNVKHGVEIILKEMTNSVGHLSKMAVVKSEEDAVNGIVYLAVDRVLTQKAGVWLAMALVWDHGILRKQYPFYFEITPNLAVYTPAGPITITEVRMAVRDLCPEMNFLIDTVEFKDHEVAWAIRRPIEYWNEVPPPITQFTPSNFPFRYHWMEAVIGELLVLVATWLRRNDLDYSAGGLSVQDTKKWGDYIKMAEGRKKDWKEFVKNKKIEMNLEGGYGNLGGYRYAPYR